MKKIINTISKHPFIGLLILTIGSIILGSQAVNIHKDEKGNWRVKCLLRIDTSADSMMVDDCPERKHYNNVKDTFGSDNLVVIYIKDKNLFTVEKLEILQEMAMAIEDIPHIAKVQSLFTTKNFKGENGMLSTEPFFDYIPDTKEEIEAIRKDALNNPTIAGNLISRDGNALAINIYLETDAKASALDQEISKQIVAEINKVNGKFDSIFQIGMPWVRQQLSEGIMLDAATITPLALIVLLLSLLICSRSTSGAIVPVITSFLSILWTAGFMAYFDLPITVVLSIVPALIIVIGSSEDIHIISEFHEGLHETGSKMSALNYVGEKIGTALFLTFFTTFFGFLSIYFNDIRMLKEFGIISGAALLANFIITILVNPIYLLFFGRKKPEESDDEESKNQTKEEQHPNALLKLGDYCIKITKNHRKPVAIIFSIILIVMLVGISKIKVNNEMMGYFKDDSEITIRSNRISKEFSGIKTFFIVFDAGFEGAFKKSKFLKQISATQKYIDSQGAMDASYSISDYLSLINREMKDSNPDNYKIPDNDKLISQYYLFLSRDEIDKYVNADYSKACILVRESLKGSMFVDKYTTEIKKYLKDNIKGMNVTITGEEVLMANAANGFVEGQAISLVILSLVVFIIMSLLFTDFKAGILSLIPNIFPVVVLFGVMGFCGVYLDTGTALIGAIAIGIAMDDTIHFMVRYNKEMKIFNNQVKAMEVTIKSEVVPVFSTTMATALGFGVLTMSSFKPLIYFGILTALSMMCALVTDLLITPILLISTRLVSLWDMVALEVNEGVLENSPLFQGMGKWEIKKIILTGDVKTFNAGDKIISQGDTGREMYLILNGDTYVALNNRKEQTKTIAKMVPGDIFGEIALVSELERTADIIAGSETTVLKLEWSSLERMRKFLPMISSKLFLNISKIIGARFATQLKDKE